VPFLPDGFLEVAEKMQQRRLAPSGEARDRTITGRSYYAAYLATCDAICSQYGYQPDAYLPHEAVSTTLAAVQGDPSVRLLGTRLDSLRLLRKHADYTRRKPLTEDQSDDAVEHAKKVLELLPSVAGRLPKIDPKDPT